jgi:hypothetical protein
LQRRFERGWQARGEWGLPRVHAQSLQHEAQGVSSAAGATSNQPPMITASGMV